MIALVMAVALPIVALQLYKIYVGHISVGIQVGFALAMAMLTGLALYFIYRSSARNQP